MAFLIKSNMFAKSTKVLLGTLYAVCLTILLLKMQRYRGGGETESFHDIQIPYVQLIPRYTVIYPWVICTSIFAEITITSLIISTIVLYVSTKYVEKFWGFREVIKFVLLIGSITNLITVLTTIVFNLVRGDVSGMDKPLGGGISYYFGFLVVLKQLIPEHNIILFQGLINFRAKHLPFVLLVAVLFWSIVVSRSLYPSLPSLGSFFTSYIYLRFFQRFSMDPLLPVTMANGGQDSVNSSVLKGDASDTFLLSEFFPSVIKPYVSVVFASIYDVSCFLGIITPFTEDSIEQSNLRAQKRQEQANQVQKSVANSVAERRRQVALQVIEDRISRNEDHN